MEPTFITLITILGYWKLAELALSLLITLLEGIKSQINKNKPTNTNNNG